MLKKILSTMFIITMVTTVLAQDSTKDHSLHISGSADAYFRYDLNNPQSKPYNNFTSFTNSQNSFELGMFSLKAEQTLGKAGFVADIGFGKRAEEFSYNDKSSSVAIKQLYFTYAPTSRLKFTIGSWTTHIGYELVDAYLNRNYSMSYLFSYGPFSHTGVKAEYDMGNKTTVMLGLANPFDLKYASNLPKMVIGQIAKATNDDQLKVFLSYQGGKYNDSSRLYQADMVVNYVLTSVFSLGCNGTVQSRQGNFEGKWQQSKTWWGTALYLNADPKDWLGFTLRGEYFDDKKNALGLNAGIFETTLSANFKIDNLTIIPEFRFENAGQKIYAASNGDLINRTSSLILGAAYHF